MATVVELVAIDYFAYPYGIRPVGRSFNRGENGLWLRYKWYFGEHSETEVSALGRDLLKREIRYAWFHVRYITPNGKLKFRYEKEARRLTTALHKVCPDVKLMAWIYAEAPGNPNGVDLRNARLRSAMVGEARWLVENCGFDGVQWDYEICPDGDAGLIQLIRDTRAGLSKDALLGAAVPMWLPAPVGALGWSDRYMGRVAAECDQISVMCYDSGFILPRAYVWVVTRQAIHATRAASASNPKCRVLLGVPTYGAAGPSHNLRAETLSNALAGVQDGMANPESNLNSFAGVAIFADYTTNAAQWGDYEKYWLRK